MKLTTRARYRQRCRRTVTRAKRCARVLELCTQIIADVMGRGL